MVLFENDCFKIVCVPCVVGRNLLHKTLLLQHVLGNKVCGVLQVNQSNINKDTKGNGKEAVRKLN